MPEVADSPADRTDARDAQAEGVTPYLPDVVDGDSEAVGEVARQWLPRVVRVLERKLKGLRAADAEGVADSVFLALWRHADGGRFEAGSLADADDLWRWLMRVADRKAIDYARSEKALKRGGGRTRGEGSVWQVEGEGGSRGFDALGSPEMTPLEHVAFTDTFEQFMAALPNDLTREVVVGRLERRTGAEIARSLGVCQKTVKRKLAGVRELVLSGEATLSANGRGRGGEAGGAPEAD